MEHVDLPRWDRDSGLQCVQKCLIKWYTYRKHPEACFQWTIPVLLRCSLIKTFDTLLLVLAVLSKLSFLKLRLCNIQVLSNFRANKHIIFLQISFLLPWDKSSFRDYLSDILEFMENIAKSFFMINI